MHLQHCQILAGVTQKLSITVVTACNFQCHQKVVSTGGVSAKVVGTASCIMNHAVARNVKQRKLLQLHYMEAWNKAISCQGLWSSHLKLWGCDSCHRILLANSQCLLLLLPSCTAEISGEYCWCQCSYVGLPVNSSNDDLIKQQSRQTVNLSQMVNKLQRSRHT